MNLLVWLLSAAVIASTVVPAANAQPETSVRPPDFVVMSHMKGFLALQVSAITVLWYRPASEEKAAQLRILSRELSAAKTLTGADAEGVWADFHKRSDEFLFVDHMGGTQAILRAQIRTAYYSEDTGSPRLRLMYDGEPSGKTLDGEEAVRVWKEIRR